MRSLLVVFLPVCDERRDLQGIIALRDLHRVLRPGHPSTATASSLGTEPALTIGVNDPVDHVRELMAGSGYGCCRYWTGADWSESSTTHTGPPPKTPA